MGMYLNQLPPAEVARLKAELAETLIANFCYPRFYDYRTNSLRMRPVDRTKRQEVWQYLNAVDFNVWGRVDVDSPEFQRQVERLLIHFVQRNRTFFGEQGRRRMSDVRSLITDCSTFLAKGLRGHLRGQQATPPLGSPRPVSSWSPGKNGQADLPWEQMLSETVLLQQQLQETRGEALPANEQVLPASSERTNGSENGSTRRSRQARPTTTPQAIPGQGNGFHEREGIARTPAENGGKVQGEIRGTLRAREATPPRPEPTAFSPSPDASPTMPLPSGKPENGSGALPGTTSATSGVPARPRRGRSAESSSNTPASGPLPRTHAHIQPASTSTSARSLPTPRPQTQATEVAKPENASLLNGDEDIVIFEQLRYQLLLWLRVESVRAGFDLGNQSAFQLVEALRQQDGVDIPRLQVVSTLLKMCDQIISSGRATLFDYKQAMMFYLMHTRRSQ